MGSLCPLISNMRGIMEDSTNTPKQNKDNSTIERIQDVLNVVKDFVVIIRVIYSFLKPFL